MYVTGGVPSGKFVSILNRSASGFSIYAFRTSAGAVSVNWWAIDPRVS